jgi:membrane-associated protease RseP (regulator of RpoE activity)
MVRSIAWVVALAIPVALRWRQDSAKPPVDQLVLTRGVTDAADSKEMREAVERFTTRVRGLAGAPDREVRQEIRRLDVADRAASTRFQRQLGLTVYRALHEAHAESAFAFDYEPVLGVVRALGFDGRRGVEASFALKLETDHGKGDDDEDESKKAIDGVVSSMIEAYRAQQADADAAPDATPRDETAWDGGEDRPELGFRWSYVKSDSEQLAYVTSLFADSASAQAGLRRGDVILKVNGAAVTSPALFGKAVGGLKAGAALVLEVRRGAEFATIHGVVQRASEVLPAFEEGLVGSALPGFRADLGAPPVDVGVPGGAAAAKRATATIVVVFDPRRPDTLSDAAVLAWIRDQYGSDRVAIAGIASGAGEAPLRAFMDELKPGWPAAADPDGRLTEATRTVTLPALLLADRGGIVRFRHLHGGRLQHALRALLAAPR